MLVHQARRAPGDQVAAADSAETIGGNEAGELAADDFSDFSAPTVMRFQSSEGMSALQVIIFLEAR